MLYNFFCVWITLSSNSFQFMELKIQESLFLCWLACCGNVVYVVCYMDHNGGHYVLEHVQMFVLLKFYIICRSMFGVLSFHNFLNLLTVFCHPQFLDYVSYMTLPQFQFVGHCLYVVTQKISSKLSTPLPFLSPYHVF